MSLVSGFVAAVRSRTAGRGLAQRFVHGARRVTRQEGQGLAEYALLLGLIAVVAITALTFLGASIEDLVFDEIANTLGDVI
jgi:pilus assembly protein Flp/PilA